MRYSHVAYRDHYPNGYYGLRYQACSIGLFQALKEQPHFKRFMVVDQPRIVPIKKREHAGYLSITWESHRIYL
jgi:hypothetical protein